MKKHVRLCLSVTIIICSLILFSCNKVNKKDATNINIVSNSENIEKSIFTNKVNIKKLEENQVIEFSNNSKKNGILMTANANNSGAYYSRVVDLNADTIISFYALYDSIYDMDIIDIKLVDVYNENNYITVRFSQHENEDWLNVSAKSASMISFVGFDNYTNTGYTSTGSTFYGNNFRNSKSENYINYPINFAFDSLTNSVYIKQNNYDLTKIINLSDESVVGKDSIFYGFTSNKVYLNINFTKMTKSAGILISSIGNDSLSGNIDYTIPNDLIKVEENGNFYDGILEKEYTLPTPILDDFLFGSRDVVVTIKDPSSKEVIENNYKFIPQSIGEYTVCYSSKDNFNNEIKKEFILLVNETANKINVDFEEKDIYVLDKISLPEVTVTGGNGLVVANVTYNYNGNSVSDSEIKISEMGKIDVCVECVDQLGNTCKENKTYNIKAKRAIILNDAIPNTVTAGSKYKLPSFDAYDYFANKEMIKNVYIDGEVFSGSEYTVEDKNSFTLALYGDKGSENEVKEEFLINIINPNKKEDISTQFIFDKNEFENTTTSSYVSYTALKKMEKAEITYPYALSTNLLEIALQFGDYSRFNHANIILQDYVDGNKVTFSVYYNNGNYLIYYNGKNGTEYILATEYMENENEFKVIFDGSTNSILDYNYNKIFTIERDDNNNYFDGFDNCGVYLNFELYGVKENSEFRIKKISNQLLTKLAYVNGDKTKPVITFYDVFDTSPVQINDKIIIPKAIAFDALSYLQCEVKVNVFSPSGETIVNSIVLDKDIELQLSECGTYIFNFEAVDSLKNRAFQEMIIEVKDTEPPQFTAPKKIKTTVKIGETIEFPSITVKDNFSKDEDISVYVIIFIPEHGYDVVNMNEGYQFKEKGTYNVSYYIQDEAGNVTTYDFIVTVK